MYLKPLLAKLFTLQLVLAPAVAGAAFAVALTGAVDRVHADASEAAALGSNILDSVRCKVSDAANPIGPACELAPFRR